MDLKRLTIAACVFLAACNGGPDAAPAEDAEPNSYVEMTFAQRYLFMNDVVMPEMRETFVAFDAKFANMTCTTCHGTGASDGTFAMPSADITVLPTEERFPEYVRDPEHGRWAEFMLEQVWPKMASLLKVPMFDPTTHTSGFSCANCHTVETGGR
jgi:hypothetical protein